MDKSFDYRRICYIRYSLIREVHEKGCPNVIICWIRFLIRTIGYLIASPRSYKTTKEILVIIPSANNKRSTQPILDSLQHKNYFCVERFYNFLPYGKIFLRSLLHPSGFINLYKNSSSEEKRLIRTYFVEFASIEHIYKAIGKFYDYNPQIRLVIASNDHEPIMRSFFEQARIHSIKCLYSQHASVSEFFPPLTFDFSFLDGRESYIKYKSISNIEGKVFLVGSPRFDAMVGTKCYTSNMIGIAFNQIDDVDKIVFLVKKLKENGFYKIVVRPHPQQDKGNVDWSQFTELGCEISHPLVEKPFEFISRLSFLIAGASSIHLEAALQGIPSAIFNMAINNIVDIDYYGYASMNLTPIADTTDDLVALINNPHIPSPDTIRYYNAAFGTEYNGKSALLVAQFIDAFLYGKEEECLSSLFDKTQEGYYIAKKKA